MDEHEKLVNVVLQELLDKCKQAPECFDLSPDGSENLTMPPHGGKDYEYVIGWFPRVPDDGRSLSMYATDGWKNDPANNKCAVVGLKSDGSIALAIYNHNHSRLHGTSGAMPAAIITQPAPFFLFRRCSYSHRIIAKMRRLILQKNKTLHTKKVEKIVEETFPGAVDRLLLK